MTTTGSSLNQEIIENIRKEGVPIIIFGVGTTGEALFYACDDLGIKADYFCDNNINKTRVPVLDTEVIHVQDLKTKYKDAIFLISAADIQDVIDQLNTLGYYKWYPGKLILRKFNIYKYKFSASLDFVEHTVSTCILCHDGYLNPDKLFLRSVDIIITERCSLKCRDCSNLMQYYKNPKDCNTEELIKSIDRFIYE